MKTKHTPAPWSIPHFALPDEHWPKAPEGSLTTKKRCDCKYVLCDSYMGAICTVHMADARNGGDDPIPEEAIANAKLIASAPELLEAAINGDKIRTELLHNPKFNTRIPLDILDYIHDNLTFHHSISKATT